MEEIDGGGAPMKMVVDFPMHSWTGFVSGYRPSFPQYWGNKGQNALNGRIYLKLGVLQRP